jgi:hypothetical protein
MDGEEGTSWIYFRSCYGTHEVGQEERGENEKINNNTVASTGTGAHHFFCLCSANFQLSFWLTFFLYAGLRYQLGGSSPTSLFYATIQDQDRGV